MKYVLAIDQGTSSTKSLIFDEESNVIAKGWVELATDYQSNGFVEQNPEDIYQNVLDSVRNCFAEYNALKLPIESVVSCGISNQRETFVLWDTHGNPMCPAVVWACKRSIAICDELKQKGHEALIRDNTGLVIDPYFSATKLLWLIQNKPEIKRCLDKGELYFGTVDTWILYRLSEGKSYKTDLTNAHRTLLFNIHSLKWDTDILKLWGLEKLNLPEVLPSSAYFGEFNLNILQIPDFNHSIAITALVGDSHAATFGEGCFDKGKGKVTMGTGCSIMLNIGAKPLVSKHNMLTTICWSLDNRVDFAFEGAIVSCGSTIEWLKNELNFIKDVQETATMAYAIPDSGGVFLIPAFSGLGAPHWQMNRKASIEGLTFGTGINHIVRAALESISFQIKDVVEAMKQDLGENLEQLSINGGLSKNSFVMECLLNLLQISLQKQENADVSALGAAYLSGLKSGVYENMEALRKLNQQKVQIIPAQSSNDILENTYQFWRNLVSNADVNEGAR